jgi:hypothetical protein
MTITSDQLSLPQPVHDTEELVLLSRLKNIYTDARTAKRLLYSRWRRNWLLLNNQMWSDFRMTWMPSPQDNEIYPIMSGLIGWMTDQNVSFSINSAVLPGTPWAQYLEKLGDDLEALMQSNWKVLNWQSVVTLIMWDAGLYGAGIGKAVWDQALEGGEGNCNMVRVDPWNFYPDPNANSEEEASYFYEVRRLSWDEIERRFPDTCVSLADDLIWESSDNSLDSDTRPTSNRNTPGQYPMSMSAGYPNNSTSSTGLPGQGRYHAWMPDGVIVYEAWMKENRTKEIDDPNWKAPENNPDAEPPKVEVTYPDWRVVVYSANTVLFDEWASELWDGATHPYARFVFEDPGEFWPTPLVSQMAPLQISINRLYASMQQSAELTGNPIFVEQSNSGLSNSLIANRPGQRLKVNPTGSGNQGVSWLSPPTMSGDVMNLVRFAIDRMENISGLSTVSKGKAPTPRTPEAVVNQVQESGFVRVRQGLRNMEKMLRKLGTILAQLIIENYTTQKTVSILGPDGSQSAIFLQARHFIDAVEDEMMPFKYALIVNAGSDMPTSRQARMAEAQTLFVLHAIDRQALLEAAEYPHWPAIEQRMEQKEQAEAQAQAQLSARQKTGRKS